LTGATLIAVETIFPPVQMRHRSFPGAFAKYLVQKEGDLAKKRGDEQKRASYDVTPDYVAEAMR